MTPFCAGSLQCLGPAAGHRHVGNTPSRVLPPFGGDHCASGTLLAYESSVLVIPPEGGVFPARRDERPVRRGLVQKQCSCGCGVLQHSTKLCARTMAEESLDGMHKWVPYDRPESAFLAATAHLSGLLRVCGAFRRRC